MSAGGGGIEAVVWSVSSRRGLGAAGVLALSASAALLSPLGGPRERSRLEGRIDLVIGDGPEARVHGLELPDGRLRALAPAPSFPYGDHPSGAALIGLRDDVVVLEPGGGLRTLAGGAGLDWHPGLHPGGALVLFESDRDAFRALYLVPFGGGSPTRLTFDREGSFDGAWSPSGERICFSSSRAGQLDLYVMSASGTDQTRWTAHAGDAVRCGWAPSGGAIAYVSARDGRDDVLVVRAAGARPENVSAALPGPVEHFEWHPTQDVLLIGTSGVRPEVFVVDWARPALAQRLTPRGARDAHPTWSPDGAHVALVRTLPGGSPSIFAVEVSSGRADRLGPNRDGWRLRWRPHRRTS